MRVLIADDHALFRDGLHSLLEARGIDVVAEARNGKEAVDLAHEHAPEIVLMDLSMPIMSGLEATRAIVACSVDTRVVVLTASEEDADLFEAIKSGAQGFLPKDIEAARLFEMLEGVTRGEPALTPGLARKLLNEFARPGFSSPTPATTASEEPTSPDTLTEREREVLELLVQGVTSNRELADRLFISENTVKYHLRHILAKLHLQNRAQVISYALRHGLVEGIGNRGALRGIAASFYSLFPNSLFPRPTPMGSTSPAPMILLAIENYPLCCAGTTRLTVSNFLARAHHSFIHETSREPKRKTDPNSEPARDTGAKGNSNMVDMLVEESHKVTRRNFVGMLGAMGLGAASMTMYNTLAHDGEHAGSDGETAAAQGATTEHVEGRSADAIPATNTGSATSSQLSVDEMDAMHEAGIKAFPAETVGLGGQPLEYEMDGDVKVFKLTANVIDWEYAPGQRTEAWAYNGAVPGPEIRVTEEDKVRVELTNNLHESTVIHWHGLIIPNSQDGVPFMTQPPIKPGETFTYEFQIREGNTGSHMYHSHHNAAEQVTKGLLGAFIVEPKDPKKYGEYDKEYTIILNDGPIGGFTLNGKSFPATQPLTAKLGEKIFVRYMNEGLMIHPMHLHGMPQLVVAQDGWLLPQPYMCDTVNIAPGQRFDVLIECTELGVWAFHCHILSHAESKHGMFGMVTALIVEA